MDDYAYYEQEAALEEFLQESLKSISADNAKHYLGVYGDAIEARVRRCLEDAHRLGSAGFFAPAVVSASTSIELMIRFMLVRPLVQGAFLSDEWAGVLSGRIANGRTAEDRELLPAVLRQWSIDITSIRLKDGSGLWPTITSSIWPIRNKIVHQGSTASTHDAALTTECAEALLYGVVRVVAANLGFTLDNTGKWSEIRGEKGAAETGDYSSWSQSFDAASPFDGS